MPGNKTVRINNRLYDAATGLPVDDAPKTADVKPKTAPKTRPTTASSAVHATAQRSKTLHRRATKKPTTTSKRPQPGKHMDIARSGAVKHFAPHPSPLPEAPVTKPAVADKPATVHPVAKRAAAKVATKPTPTVTAKQVKEEAISRALASPKAQKPKKEKKSFTWTRRKTIVTAILVILLGAAFVTYLNLPTLSVAFASSQAGIDATYPKYVPDGYGLKQPVTFKDGQVDLTFVSRGGAGSYTIAQSRSSWDSSAVLENIVRKEAGENYIINQEGGLTIYTYDNNSGAAWVNAGILYVVSSDAPLSTNQMRRIATSL